LKLGQAGAVLEGDHQPPLSGDLLLELGVGDQGVLHVGEGILDRQPVLEQGRLLLGLGWATWPLIAPKLKIEPAAWPA
jgi:hypothetical protein